MAEQSSNTFLWKPTSDSNGNLVVLLPSSFNNRVGSVELVDGDGNVIESGSFSDFANGNRGHYRFSKPGSAYGSNVTVRANFDTPIDGQESWEFGVNSPGSRIESNVEGVTAGEANVSSGGSSSQQPTTGYTATEGSPYAIPALVDWNQLQPPYVNYQDILAYSQGAGQVARDSYYENLMGSKPYALDLVGTDIEGIQMGLNALVPRARQEGNLDTATNITRSGLIDQYNMQRIPGMNTFNQQQAAQANQQAQQMFNESVDASGLDYRRRTTDMLGRLEERARTGRLGGELDQALTADLMNRGSDLLASTGVSRLSGAGVRASDRLTVQERLNLALDAESKLPSILQQAQQTLQAPIERAPTLYSQPTEVPLNVSNIQDRVPIQSNVSAGAAQQAIGSQATNLQVIPGSQVLSTYLQNEQWNAGNLYNRDLMVMDQTQSQNTMLANVQQGAYNQEYAARMRDEQNQAYLQGLGIRAAADVVQSIGAAGGLGAAATATAGLGRGGAGTVTQGINGAPSTYNGRNIVSSSNSVPQLQLRDGTLVTDTPTNRERYANDIVASGVPTTGYELEGGGFVSTADINAANRTTGGKPTTGGTDGGSAGFWGGVREWGEDLYNDVSNWFSGNDTPSASSASSGSDVMDSVFAGDPTLGTGVGESKSSKALKTLYSPTSNIADDQKNVQSYANLIKDPTNLKSVSSVKDASKVGTKSLMAKGVIDANDAPAIERGLDTIGSFVDPNTSDVDRGIAASQLAREMITDRFTGNIDKPETINGNEVVRTRKDPDGNLIFTVRGDDGEKEVPQADLVRSVNIASSINAVGVLFSNKPKEDKLAALAGIGIRAAEANDILGQIAAGNSLAGLSILNTARNWDEMGNIDRAISLYTTTSLVSEAMANYGYTALQDAGSNALTYIGAQLGIEGATSGAKETIKQVGGAIELGMRGYSIYQGTMGMADLFKNVDDMPRSKAPTVGAVSGATRGAQIGGAIMPGWGHAIGAAVGATAGAIAGVTGGGKNTGQKMRDGWKKGLEAGGLVEKDKDGMYVTLADGTKYNIGLDGNAKLKNLDGTERNTFDVDWGNKAAADSIPAAHLYAIATGLDPKSNSKFDTFDRAVAQGLNAASSNADSVGGIQNNFKTMLKDISPEQIALRIETLRNTGKIDEQQYGVYVNTLNGMYGTKFQPSSKEESTQAMRAAIEAKPENERNDYDRQILEEIKPADEPETVDTPAEEAQEAAPVDAFGIMKKVKNPKKNARWK